MSDAWGKPWPWEKEGASEVRLPTFKEGEAALGFFKDQTYTAEEIEAIRRAGPGRKIINRVYWHITNDKED